MRPWHERFPDIYTVERSYWLTKNFEESDPQRGPLTYTGIVTVRLRGDHGLERHDFRVRFNYPPGYPYLAPTVKFLEPKITRARHQGPDGAPCLFPPSAWTTTLPASELYAVTERWLGYHLAGHFPRELTLYELPDYYAWEPFSILATPAALDAATGQLSGGFSVEEIPGHDLGVIRSLSRNSVGDTLLAELAPAKVKRTSHVGKWYRLNEEPVPMRNSHQLQAVLAQSGHQVDFKRRPNTKELIGLVFRDSALDEERLLILDIGVRSKKAVAQVGKGWSVRAPRTYIVSPDELFRRLTGVRDLDCLSSRHVVCFGLGAIGSQLALALAREGVGHFTLCDPDVLRPGNVIRHALDLTDVGEPKAEAIENAIGRVNPFAKTSAEIDGLGDPEILSRWIRDADIVIAAIGNDLTEQLLTEAAFATDARPPLVLVRTLHGGSAFRVALIRPGEDACFACLTSYREDEHPDWIHVPADDLPDVRDDGCATAARPGAGLTSQHAATFAAARTLDILENRPLDANHWLWIDRPIESADARLQTGLTLHQTRFTPREACELCRA